MTEHDLSGNTDLHQEAAEWLVRLQAEDVTEADVAAWLRWCSAAQANIKAFERMQQLHDQLRMLPLVEQRSFLAQLDTYAVSPRFWRGLAWRRDRALPLAAGMAAMLITAALMFAGLRDRSPPLEAHDYRAPKGAQQALLLSDHSQVTLASASELSAQFTADRRYLDLRHGEAYFEVQHEQRPFVVHAGEMTVTAVGTKFNVRTSGTRTVVAVTEGAVDVTGETAAYHRTAAGRSEAATVSTSAVRLRAGQQAVREAGHSAFVVVDVKPAAVTAWREGRLEFVMEPLSSVVASVNRYASRHIVIEDAALEAMVFTGTVFVDRADEWAATVPAVFPAAAAVAADGTLRLTLRDVARSGL